MTDNNATLAVLITMPHSHYCEKARWALDRLSLPYREEPHVPLLHRLATMRNGGRSVPVLIYGSGRFIDSTGILSHANAVCGGDLLYPCDSALRNEVEALEACFDEELGPHARRWAYAQLLPERRLLRQVMSRGVPRFEAALLPLIMPGVVRLVRTGLRITPESACRSIGRVHGVFNDVSERLGDGRQFLAGGRFTAADLTFAALAAPVLFPAEYRAAYPALDQIPAVMRDEVLRLRDTDAGRFALRLFLQERDRRLVGEARHGLGV
ncbi:glutathione S-transferase family protein [Collimonas antrihumi]|uniref:glutathione S-transferase family protein n=1 Tax=Collimonas antrihumi TaxID=1940615 RepID=UPI001B8C3DA3|nr:glutathione S-transferase family protein [Collimonas antrihumi]